MKKSRRVSDKSPKTLSGQSFTGDEEPAKSEVKLATRLVYGVALFAFMVTAFMLGNFVGNLVINKRYDILASFQEGFSKEKLTSFFQSLSKKQKSSENQPGAVPPPATILIDGVEVKLPGPNATQQEQEAFSEIIRKAGKEIDFVEFGSDCLWSPPAVRAIKGTTITIQNKDNKDHSLAIGDVKDSILKIPAGGRQIVQASLKGEGLYAVQCDEKIIAGFLQIIFQPQ